MPLFWDATALLGLKDVVDFWAMFDLSNVVWLYTGLFTGDLDLALYCMVFPSE